MDKKSENRISVITRELEKLGEHIKVYNIGAYPLFCLQTQTILRVHDIQRMRLSDISQNIDGMVRIRKEIRWRNKDIPLSEKLRRELAWYVMQRINVIGTTQEILEAAPLCVNRLGNPLSDQNYRKMLERSSDELKLSRIYNSQYLRSLYGYLEIAYGRKTIEDVADEYGVQRYYLLSQIFHGMEIEYESSLLDAVACTVASEGGNGNACAD